MVNTKSDNTKTYSEWLMEDLHGKYRVELYLMGRSGDKYQVRIWLENERKYLRRSTKTSDLDSARSKAREIYLKVY